ncbi:DWNN domain, a CCHC-type zinc finger [Trifolium repens]|nr:DWNN domain, a CCHC-type zinc finger [Trifolium repens]
MSVRICNIPDVVFCRQIRHIVVGKVVAPIYIISLKMYEETYLFKKEANLRKKKKGEGEEEGFMIRFNQTVSDQDVDTETVSDDEIIRQQVENKAVETNHANSNLAADDMSAMKYTEDSDWDEFGNDLYSIPDQLPVQPINIISEAPPTSNIDEESKIKALIDTPALDWQQQGSEVLEGAWVDGWRVDVVSLQIYSSLKREVICKKSSSVQGIVRPPIG